MRKFENPILTRIASIREDYLDGIDEADCPTDPAEFLEKFWELEMSKCKECVLAQTRTQVVKWDGIVDAPIMVVLEAPGQLEDLAGIPLVGPMELRGSRCGHCENVRACYSYRLLNRPNEFRKKQAGRECDPKFTEEPQLNSKFYMRSSGALIDGILLDQWKFAYPRNNWIEQYNTANPTKPWTHKSPFFFTNSVLCRGTDASKSRDMPPEAVPAKKCKRWLAFQWACVQPKLTLAFGKVSAAILLGSEAAARRATYNEIQESKFGPVMCQIHPASFMREPNKELRGYGYAKIQRTLELALEQVGLPT